MTKTTESEHLPERALGFGSVVARAIRTRLLNRDGTFNMRRKGRSGCRVAGQRSS
jgi:hypothetical protein